MKVGYAVGKKGGSGYHSSPFCPSIFLSPLDSDLRSKLAHPQVPTILSSEPNASDD
jgi:hypothetical protein